MSPFSKFSFIRLDVDYLEEVSNDLYEYILSISVKSVGKNVPVPVAGTATTSVAVSNTSIASTFCNPVIEGQC
jgi:hypothetical protein